MPIKDHYLFSEKSELPLGTSFASPNTSDEFNPRFVVIHYTVLRETATVLEWFADPERKVSAHFVISPEGIIHQCAPLNQRAWHAGQSSWQGTEQLNSCAIGIELVNAGRLEWKKGWESWFGEPISSDRVVEAWHPNETASHTERTPGWEKFTPEQITSAKSLVKELCELLPIEQILGHDEIAPGRKWDPGPAFPWNAFRNEDRTPLL
jgi:N-acetylmuramoyl-L-alanine amidase